MKQLLQNMIFDSIRKAYGNISYNTNKVEIFENKVKAHGDFSTNIAMILASAKKMPPRKIADDIIKNLDDKDKVIEKIEIAGPGFINFFFLQTSFYPVLSKIHDEDLKYGASNIGNGKKIQVEFVSANPTGPLHVGHGRGAVVGDTIANILSFVGYNVTKEYYINDSGRQIDTLGRSVFLRYKELLGEKIDLPENYYQGEYIISIAKSIINLKNDEILNKEEKSAVMFCAKFAADDILNGINKDLIDFGVNFDVWYSEQSLYDSSKVDESINKFKTQNLIYEKDGALWFKTAEYGDEKDRVVVRSNGQTTYFASDIAYHIDKFNRGFDKVIDVWGADHHGYIPRISSFLKACDIEESRFNVVLIHLVNLLRDKQPVAMSTRTGEFVTLKEVVDEVGCDAARFIFLTRHYESPLDFDIELAKKKTNDNPVYYVQYVHARISSIIRKGKEEKNISLDLNKNNLELLKEPEEIEIIKLLSKYPEIVASSAEYLEPHRITYYLIDLASNFHAYYNKHKVLTDEEQLTKSRIYLIQAVQKVIRNGLNLLGVSAPEKM
ncbi:MAG: arginine--tRNA ligase [Desulfobacterales bacterium]|nr:arginine--tRNA ligase [Desulfobacterales bacterium]